MKKICLACLLCALPFAAQAQQVPGAARVSTKAPDAETSDKQQLALCAAADEEKRAGVETGATAAKTPDERRSAALLVPCNAADAAKQAGVQTEATGFVPLLGGLGALGGVAAAGVVAAAVAAGGGGATTDTQ